MPYEDTYLLEIAAPQSHTHCWTHAANLKGEVAELGVQTVPNSRSVGMIP